MTIGITPSGVYGAGRAVSGLNGDAQSCCTGLRTSLVSAEGGMGNHVVSSALSRYVDQHILDGSTSLPVAIEALGQRVANFGASANDRHEEAAHDMAAYVAAPTDIAARLRVAV